MEFDSHIGIARIKAALLPLAIDNGEDQVTREGQRSASVLMPLVMREQWQVILTQRPMSMAQHAGQIAFPGGKREPGETALDAALRETEEEIGIPAPAITPLRPSAVF